MGKSVHGEGTDKKTPNAGSNNFNEGSEQDPNYNKGTRVTDKEKKTGHLDDPGAEKNKGKDEPGTGK